MPVTRESADGPKHGRHGMRRAATAALVVMVTADAVGAASGSSRSSGSFAPGEIEGVVRRVADREVRGAGAWPIDWQHAVLAMGVLAAYEATGEARYRSALEEFAARHRWRPGGRFYHADDHAVAQVYLGLFRLAPDRRAVAGFQEALDRLIDRPWRWSKRHQTGDYWWSDALFMSPPAVAKLAAITGEERYLEWMDARWRAAHEALFDESDGLYHRDLRYRPGAAAEVPRLSRGRSTFWLRGNAWVLAGLARLLEELPASWGGRGFYERIFRQLAASLVGRQGPDGLWRADLDAGATTPGETSGSALLCSGLAWGLTSGALEEERYRRAVERAWTALAARADADGRLGWVQPPGAAPGTFDATDSAPYGAGALLLAGSEVLRLAAH